MNQEGWKIFDAEYAAYYDATTAHLQDAAEAAGLAARIESYGGGGYRTILDVGCGTGRHARLLADMGYRVVGLDPSLAMIRKAEAAGGRVTYRCGRIEESWDQKFDFAYSLGHVPNYLPDEAALTDFLGGVRRVLRSGGAYYFECWNPLAILKEAPKPVLRFFSDGKRHMRREVIPDLSGIPETLSLRYRMEIPRSGEGGMQVMERVHFLRLFSQSELAASLENVGFSEWSLSAAITEPETMGPDARFLGVWCRV
ncbi:MAG: class I SAM-dependent methyltransferase [bacterium]